jgi:CO/xanthine dehydrogenase Mo-binding subunit
MSQVVGRLLVEGDAPPALERELAVVGHSINRRDALEKVTGKAMYSSDMVLPGMLHAKILRCPHAHARIRSIDVTRAAALPGVEAILTKDNTRDWHTQWYMIAQPAFPDTVAYAGQEVAVVAASTADIARAAVDLIDVDYEVLRAVFTPKAAMKAGAPLVPVLDVEKPRDHNVQRSEYLQSRGDVTRGFNEADVVTESRRGAALPTGTERGLPSTSLRKACGTSNVNSPSHLALPRTRCVSSSSTWAVASARRQARSV